jgi:hypothetical protein
VLPHVRANHDGDASGADGGFAAAFVRERIAQRVHSGEGLRALLDVTTRSGLLWSATDVLIKSCT